MQQWRTPRRPVHDQLRTEGSRPSAVCEKSFVSLRLYRPNQVELAQSPCKSVSDAFGGKLVWLHSEAPDPAGASTSSVRRRGGSPSILRRRCEVCLSRQ